MSGRHVDLRGSPEAGSAGVPRPSGGAITDLGDVWPEVERLLRRMLRRRGVPADDAEEIAQETALRALAGNVSYTTADDLFRWASVVGWRIAIDRRRRARWVTGDPVPDRPALADVAAAVEQRLLLAKVAEQLPTLSGRDRAALASPAGDPADRRESVRLAVARHRARGRLRALLDGLAAVLGWLRIRRSRRAGSERVNATTETASAAAAAGLVAAAVFLSLVTPMGDPAVPAARGERAVLPAGERQPTGRASAEGDPPRALPADPPAPAPSRTRPVAVAIPKPGGGEAGAGLRPKEEGESLACAESPVTEPLCIDPPPLVADLLPS